VERRRGLGLPEGRPNVICRMQRIYANDLPVQIAVSYVPAASAEGAGFGAVDSGSAGLLNRFAEPAGCEHTDP
jgi:hypothetical protein